MDDRFKTGATPERVMALHQLTLLSWAELQSHPLAREDGDRLGQFENDLDAVFFATSNSKSFASDADRAAFRDLWLGQYLDHRAGCAIVAVASGRVADSNVVDSTSRPRIIGYTVAWPERADREPRFKALSYFSDLETILSNYPAHLHINIAPDQQCAGLGGKLLARLKVELTQRAVPGVHLMTEVGARNVAFYKANGFVDLSTVAWRERLLVCLGCRLSG